MDNSIDDHQLAGSEGGRQPNRAFIDVLIGEGQFETPGFETPQVSVFPGLLALGRKAQFFKPRECGRALCRGAIGLRSDDLESLAVWRDFLFGVLGSPATFASRLTQS